MDLYPAIDIRGGRCVRLVEGDFDRETVYGDDPVAVARSFARAGASWIHVVDLDAARSGAPLNRGVVARIAGAVDGVNVQTGGGVRTLDDAAWLIDAGIARVVLGTAAIEHPALVGAVAARWPGRVAVGLDHRGGEVRVRGWEQAGGRSVGAVVPEVVAAGASAVIVTDISRDGRQSGPDIGGLKDLLAETGAPIIASGGVSGLSDIEDLASVRTTAGQGLVGVIAGRAVYEGSLDVGAAVAWLRTTESGAR
jgi:phosphoribosylformimino-5-aminoimidazole carboxamide ribotide isomerase